MSEISDLGYQLLVKFEYAFWALQVITLIASYKSPNVRFIILTTIFYRLASVLLPPILDHLYIFAYLAIAAINLAVILSISRRKKVAAFLSAKTKIIPLLSEFFNQSVTRYRRTTSEISIMLIYFVTAIYFVLIFLESGVGAILKYQFDIIMPIPINDFFYMFHFVMNAIEAIIFLALTYDGIKNYYGDVNESS